MSNPIFISIADLRDPHDPAGRSYRQINAEKTHAIPLGSLVEVGAIEDYTPGGVRMFVVAHHRDCDMTPLYALGWGDDVELYHPGSNGRLWSGKVWHGHPESALTVICGPRTPTAPPE